MGKTKEARYLEERLLPLGRRQRFELLNNSNLNDRELDLLQKRFINGLSLKECAEIYMIEINTVSKQQLKAVKKLYTYLSNN